MAGQLALSLARADERPDLVGRARRLAARHARHARAAPFLISFARQALVALERDSAIEDLRTLAPLAEDALAMADGSDIEGLI